MVKQIECTVKKEWLEKEWKFKETTSDEKMYTGRSYPAREYLHTITLKDGRTITGPLSAIVYVQPRQTEFRRARRAASDRSPNASCLNKRNKGEIGQRLEIAGLRQADQVGQGGDGRRRRRGGGRETKTRTRTMNDELNEQPAISCASGIRHRALRLDP